MLTLATFPAVAAAHAELLEASPNRSETVGGLVEEISLQFVGLADPGQHEILVLDPLGTQLEILDFEQDFNRLNATIAALTIEGEYIVSYQTLGVDGDLGTGSFTFTYDEAADPPDGIGHRQQTDSVDWVTIALIATTVLAAVAWLAYVANRLRRPVPDTDLDGTDNQADDGDVTHPDGTDDDAGSDADASADLEEFSDDDERLAGPDVGFATGVTKRKVRRDDE